MTASKIYSKQYSNNSLINDLVYNHKGGLLAYADKNITYNFQKPNFTIDEFGRYTKTLAWTELEKARFEDTLDAYRSVSGLTFKRVDSDSSLLVDLDIRKADVNHDKTINWQGGVSAYAFQPNEAPYSGLNDAVFRSDSYNNTAANVADGSSNFYVQLHEIGHAFGLDHPHETDFDGSTSSATPGNHGLNDSRYTVMSYRHTSDYFPSSLMALDIAAIQYLYGANTRVATGNNVYDLQDVLNKTYKTIWDAGGNDSIRYSGNANIVIDLRAAHINENAATIVGEGSVAHNYNGAAGYFSGFYDGAQYDDRGSELNGGYYIANGAVIENAYGGSGNDRLIGNSANNRLEGGSGADTLLGGSGVDQLYGNSGNDVIYGGLGGDQLYGGSGIDRLYGQDGNDFLSGSEGNDIVYGGAGNDIIVEVGGNDKLYGDSGNDTIYGGSGWDKLYGGSGDDKLYGQDGNDRLEGQKGNDFLSGGKGADDYIFSLGDGSIIIDDYASDGSTDQLFFQFKLSSNRPTMYWKNNDDLYIDFGSQGDITVTDWRVGNNYQIEEFVFNDLNISSSLFLTYFGVNG